MSIEKAEKHLVEVEPQFANLIAKHGRCVLVEEDSEASIYESLMRAILFQQLSGKAASTIRNRLYALFPGHTCPPPEQLMALTTEEFRAVGVSRQKAGYLHDFASKAHTIPSPQDLDTLTDDEIVERLISIKGVGRWTVEMLLIFQLGRFDVLPVDDFGVRSGFGHAYQKGKMPTPKELLAFGEKWRPHRTTAAWYLWRAADASKKKK